MLGLAALQRTLVDLVCLSFFVSAQGSAGSTSGQSFAGLDGSPPGGSQTLSWESIRPSLPVMPPYTPKLDCSGEACLQLAPLAQSGGAPEHFGPVAALLMAVAVTAASCFMRKVSLVPQKASDTMGKAEALVDIPWSQDAPMEVPSSQDLSVDVTSLSEDATDVPLSRTLSEDAPSDVPMSEDASSETSSDPPSLPCVSRDATFLRNVDESGESFAIRIQIQALAKDAFGDSSDGSCAADEFLAALLLGGEVVAFACYSVRRNFKSLSVSKLAVAPCHRRRGLGKLLLRNLVRLGKARGRGQEPLERICLSALPDSVAFYEAFGFQPDHSVKVPSSRDLVEGQVYMEYELRRKPPKK